MATNYGLLNTAAQGIQAGLIAYQTTKKNQRDEDVARLVHGIQVNPDGSVGYTPEKQSQLSKEQEMKSLKQEQELGLLSPDSEYSQRLVGAAKSAGYEVPEGISGSELEKISPLLRAKASAEERQAQLAQQDRLSRERLGLEKMRMSKEDEVPKQNQAQAAGFATRADRASKTIDQLANVPQQSSYELQQLGVFPERFKSEDVKKLNQSSTDFISAVLRKESGASISEGEWAMARKQYIPQPGDTPEVIKQKAENREIALNSIRAEAGPRALGKIEGQISGRGILNPSKASPSAPKKGDELDGYIFKGGNPADPKSWEKK